MNLLSLPEFVANGEMALSLPPLRPGKQAGMARLLGEHANTGGTLTNKLGIAVIEFIVN